jgi:tRNA(adenine34) deaminase
MAKIFYKNITFFFLIQIEGLIFVLKMNEKLNSDEYYMKQALSEAQKAFERGEVPVGAVIVCNNRIIARAHNLTETLTDVTAHAEMQAITAAASFLGGKYLVDCTLYATVEPCPMCAGALGWSQISRIVYGAPDEKRGYLKFAPLTLHPHTKVTSGLLAEEAAGLMKRFFQNKR